MQETQPKILFCAFQVVPDSSGLSTRATEFIRALQGRATVDALTLKTPDHPHIERYLGARLMRVPVGTGDMASRLQAFERALRRQLESDDYNVAIFTDPFSGSILADLKSQHRFKLIYDACSFPSVELPYTDPHVEGDRQFMADLRRWESFCLKAADHVLTGSAVTRDYIAAQGVAESRTQILGPAVELKHFAAASSARPDRIPMRMIYLGSEVSWQGLPTLLFAVKEAIRQPAASGIKLTILGPRSEAWHSQLEEQVKAGGLQSNVEFMEPVSRDDLPRVLSQHDVGMAPLEKSGRNLNQGGLVMKLAEYAAAGRAMIVADLPLARRLVDERVALFHPTGRESALAQAIVTLAKDPSRRVQMGAAARALAVERFDGVKVGEELWSTLARLGGFDEAAASASAGPADSDAPTSVGQVAPAPEADTGQTALPFDERRDPRLGTDPAGREPRVGTDPAARDPRVGTDPSAPAPAAAAEVVTGPTNLPAEVPDVPAVVPAAILPTPAPAAPSAPPPPLEAPERPAASPPLVDWSLPWDQGLGATSPDGDTPLPDVLTGTLVDVPEPAPAHRTAPELPALSPESDPPLPPLLIPAAAEPVTPPLASGGEMPVLQGAVLAPPVVAKAAPPSPSIAGAPLPPRAPLPPVSGHLMGGPPRLAPAAGTRPPSGPPILHAPPVLAPHPPAASADRIAAAPPVLSPSPPMGAADRIAAAPPVLTPVLVPGSIGAPEARASVPAPAPRRSGSISHPSVQIASELARPFEFIPALPVPPVPPAPSEPPPAPPKPVVAAPPRPAPQPDPFPTLAVNAPLRGSPTSPPVTPERMVSPERTRTEEFNPTPVAAPRPSAPAIPAHIAPPAAPPRRPTQPPQAPPALPPPPAVAAPTPPALTRPPEIHRFHAPAPTAGSRPVSSPLPPPLKPPAIAAAPAVAGSTPGPEPEPLLADDDFAEVAAPPTPPAAPQTRTATAVTAPEIPMLGDDDLIDVEPVGAAPTQAPAGPPAFDPLSLGDKPWLHGVLFGFAPLGDPKPLRPPSTPELKIERLKG